MVKVDPKRYDLAIKQLQDALNGNTRGYQQQAKEIQVIQKEFGGFQSVVADEIAGITGEFEIVRSDIADFNVTITNKLVAAEGQITAISGDLLSYKKVVTENFTAASAEIDNVSGNLANFQTTITNQLKASQAEIESVSGHLADFISGEFGTLSSGVANLKTLMFGSATGTTITTEFANSVVSHIGTAQIESGMIKELAFEKIIGFDVNTTNLTIHSEDGRSQWKDNTILIKDSARPRVQIGKDASGDYNMYVWDAAGSLMFDALGLTDSGIQREIIRNDMVAQDAAINAAKLDIDSLFRVVNEDESHTLKSTKVYFDSEQQTLDVIFNSMTTDIGDAQKEISSARTEINAANGKVDIIVQSMENVGTELEATKTQASQTAEKFTWLVKSGTNETDFTLSDRVAELTAEKINLSGLVTFSGLDESAQAEIIDKASATTLRIDSSRGTVFKNNEVKTVLSVVIYKAQKRITDMAALREEYGNTARLEWMWQRLDEERFGLISASDKKIGNDGFTLTLTAEDVDTKVVFLCKLIVD